MVKTKASSVHRIRFKKALIMSGIFFTGFSALGLAISVPMYLSTKASIENSITKLADMSGYMVELMAKLGIPGDERFEQKLSDGYVIMFENGETKVYKTTDGTESLLVNLNSDGTMRSAASSSGAAAQEMLSIVEKAINTLGNNETAMNDILGPYVNFANETSDATEALVSGVDVKEIYLHNEIYTAKTDSDPQVYLDTVQELLSHTSGYTQTQIDDMTTKVETEIGAPKLTEAERNQLIIDTNSRISTNQAAIKTQLLAAEANLNKASAESSARSTNQFVANISTSNSSSVFDNIASNPIAAAEVIISSNFGYYKTTNGVESYLNPNSVISDGIKNAMLRAGMAESSYDLFFTTLEGIVNENKGSRKVPELKFIMKENTYSEALSSINKISLIEVDINQSTTPKTEYILSESSNQKMIDMIKIQRINDTSSITSTELQMYQKFEELGVISGFKNELLEGLKNFATGKTTNIGFNLNQQMFDEITDYTTWARASNHSIEYQNFLVQEITIVARKALLDSSRLVFNGDEYKTLMQAVCDHDVENNHSDLTSNSSMNNASNYYPIYVEPLKDMNVYNYRTAMSPAVNIFKTDIYASLMQHRHYNFAFDLIHKADWSKMLELLSRFRDIDYLANNQSDSSAAVYYSLIASDIDVLNSVMRMATQDFKARITEIWDAVK